MAQLSWWHDTAKIWPCYGYMCGSQLSYFVLLQHLHMLAQQEQQNANTLGIDSMQTPQNSSYKLWASHIVAVGSSRRSEPWSIVDQPNIHCQKTVFICMLVGSGVWRVPTPCVRLNRLSKSVVRWVCMCTCVLVSVSVRVPNMQHMKYQSNNQVCLVCTNPSLIWQISKPSYST